MANAYSIGLVMSILDADPRRQVIVVSAPGIDSEHDVKVTDLLLRREFGAFQERMHQLGRDLGWVQRDQVISKVVADIYNKPFKDFRASRGEYTTARMLADLTGAQFMDAKDFIQVSLDQDKNRSVKEDSYEAVHRRLVNRQGRVVVPGFYGIDRKGWIRTLPRDGSDISGAVIARGLRAQIYEIFSDTNGIMTADPNQNPDAAPISNMTYMRLAESGAVHPQIARILEGTGISINYRNTFDPDHPGTWITSL